MLEAVIIFVAGVICGIVASQLRLRLIRKKVRLYESYIQDRLKETVPFDRDRIESHEADPPPKARGSFPDADQRR